jgi:hypothetical protein
MINILENEKILGLLKETTKIMRKKAVTLGSLTPDENTSIENGVLITYVKSSNGGIVEETRNTLKEGFVIARNPEVIGEKDGKKIYNEWLVPKDTWLKNYEKEPTNEFKPYKKQVLVKMVVIDQEILEILGSNDGETAKIAVDWTTEGMTVYKGGVLTDSGCGIAPQELNETYEDV